MHTLLVHGWMVTGRVWDELRRRLDPNTHAPTLLPASGEDATTTLHSLAARVVAEAERLGLARFRLVGHSMGGQVAQLVAASAPERVASLTLVNPVPLAGLSLPAEVAAAFRASGADRGAQGGILDQACLELTPAARESLLDDAAAIAPSWIARGLDLFTAGAEPEASERIRCPTLVVATDDPFLPPAFLEQSIVARIPGARLSLIRGPGHYPQIERPNELASTLASFFEESAA